MFIKLQYHFLERYWWYQWSQQTKKWQFYIKSWNASCKKNHIRTPRVPSSRAEVSYRKPRTSSGGFNRKGCFYCGCAITEREKKTKKSCNVSYKNQEVDKAANKLSLTENTMSGPMTLKALCLCEDAVYHIHCSSGF